MSYVSMLDELLSLAEEESSVGKIGGRLYHSAEYDRLYDILMGVLMTADLKEDENND